MRKEGRQHSARVERKTLRNSTTTQQQEPKRTKEEAAHTTSKLDGLLHIDKRERKIKKRQRNRSVL